MITSKSKKYRQYNSQTKKDKQWSTLHYTTLHRKLKIEQTNPQNAGINPCELAVPFPLVDIHDQL